MLGLEPVEAVVAEAGDEVGAAVARGLTEAGCDVLDIGVGGTEMVYFGTSELGADGGIMVTASHNPPSDNAVKVYWSTGGQRSTSWRR